MLGFKQAKQAGNLLKMRGEMSNLQKQLKSFKQSYEESGSKVSVLGDGTIDYLEIDGQSREDVKKLLNRARESVQKEAAKQVIQTQGISGLLKGFGQ